MKAAKLWTTGLAAAKSLANIHAKPLATELLAVVAIAVIGTPVESRLLDVETGQIGIPIQELAEQVQLELAHLRSHEADPFLVDHPLSTHGGPIRVFLQFDRAARRLVDPRRIPHVDLKPVLLGGLNRLAQRIPGGTWLGLLEFGAVESGDVDGFRPDQQGVQAGPLHLPDCLPNLAEPGFTLLCLGQAAPDRSKFAVRKALGHDLGIVHVELAQGEAIALLPGDLNHQRQPRHAFLDAKGSRASPPFRRRSKRTSGDGMMDSLRVIGIRRWPARDADRGRRDVPLVPEGESVPRARRALDRSLGAYPLLGARMMAPLTLRWAAASGESLGVCQSVSSRQAARWPECVSSTVLASCIRPAPTYSPQPSGRPSAAACSAEGLVTKFSAAVDVDIETPIPRNTAARAQKGAWAFIAASSSKPDPRTEPTTRTCSATWCT